MEAYLHVKAEVISQMHVKILHTVVNSLVLLLGIQDPIDLEIISKGLLERQIIAKLFIYYLSSDEKTVGKVVINIDWSTYHLLVQLDDELEFKMSLTLPTKQQISEVSLLLTKYMIHLQKAHIFKQIKVVYSYTQEVWENKQRLEEAQKFLDIRPVYKLPDE